MTSIGAAIPPKPKDLPSYNDWRTKHVTPPPADPIEYAKWREQFQPPVIAVGTVVPDLKLARCVTESTRASFSTYEELSKGTCVLFTVPKPFTPTCSHKHLPTFLEEANLKKLRDAGVTKVFCAAATEPDVFFAWGEKHKTGEHVTFIPDPFAVFAEKLGLLAVSPPERGLGLTFKRAVIVIKDGKIDAIQVEDNAAEVSKSNAVAALALLGHKDSCDTASAKPAAK